MTVIGVWNEIEWNSDGSLKLKGGAAARVVIIILEIEGERDPNFPHVYSPAPSPPHLAHPAPRGTLL